VSGLISRYLEAGRAEVRLNAEEAVTAFGRVVVELAPRDRLEASFSTTPAPTHALSVSPSAPQLLGIPASAEALARLALWRLARGRLPEPVRVAASLRGAHLPWLEGVLDVDDLAESYAARVRAVRTEPPGVRDAAWAHLRRVLERALAGVPPNVAGEVLAQLIRENLVSDELGVPPLWLARVVLRTGCLSSLPGPLLPRVLDALALPMILESLQRAPSLTFLARLAGLPPAPQPALGAAMIAPMRQILAEGVNDRNLAPAFALLLLHDHACGSEP
jgi:hypothetical protein